MADSNITKRALANALKELMREQPFPKISISDICDRCDMKRKSFYYHFKDKYDLFNWCFDTEFIECVNLGGLDDRWDMVERACAYLYENKEIYRNALKVTGQNCFSEHLREFCFPIFKVRISNLAGTELADDFAVNFFTDAAICAILRWLADKQCMPPEKFTARLKRLVQNGAVLICEEMEQKK